MMMGPSCTFRAPPEKMSEGAQNVRRAWAYADDLVGCSYARSVSARAEVAGVSGARALDVVESEGTSRLDGSHSPVAIPSSAPRPLARAGFPMPLPPLLPAPRPADTFPAATEVAACGGTWAAAAAAHGGWADGEGCGGAGK
jgi:hypothetical protein